MGNSCCSGSDNDASKPTLIRGVKISNASLKLVRGQITEYETDAVINAANACLQHSGGTSRQILAKAGESVRSECKSYIRKHG
jgi:O-acetyl-ADP-ribose deacetylase (regulator of RNase III)